MHWYEPLYSLLSQVFLETLRMHPPGPATLREAPEGLSLSGYEIPRGTMVMVRIGGSIYVCAYNTNLALQSYMLNQA